MNVKNCKQKCHFKPLNVAIFAKNDKKNRLIKKLKNVKKMKKNCEKSHFSVEFRSIDTYIY